MEASGLRRAPALFPDGSSEIKHIVSCKMSIMKIHRNKE
jgi:hypothetical protein